MNIHDRETNETSDDPCHIYRDSPRHAASCVGEIQAEEKRPRRRLVSGTAEDESAGKEMCAHRNTPCVLTSPGRLRRIGAFDSGGKLTHTRLDE